MTPEIVQHVARLARLELAPDDVARLEQDLAQILGHFEDLQAIDTDGVPPMLHPTDAAMPLRDDAVQAGLDPRAILDQAPGARDGRFLVPKVVG